MEGINLESVKNNVVIELPLTKRQWFAGMALQGFCSNRDYLISANESAKKIGKTLAELISEVCYEHADAMIFASQKEGTNAQ